MSYFKLCSKKIVDLKKTGFTLIELLAVIVILAIIALIATPTILGVIEKAKKGAAEASALGYIDAVEKLSLTSSLNGDDSLNEGTYEVPTLNSKVDIKGKKPTLGNVTVNSDGEVTSATLAINGYKVSYTDSIAKVVSSEITDMTYTENVLKGTDPVLGTGMIPVTIANDGTVTYADVNKEWYNYTDKKWANAVKLSSGTYAVGQVIPESAIQSYFVWIPRYKYKIFNIGNYTSGITGTPTSSTKQSIEIVFESKDKTVSTGNTVGSYLTHPAFTALDTNGIWVGKFETGYLGATTKETAQVTSSDQTKIIVKPNVFSWRNNTIYNMFVSSYNYDRTNDSHMMKNTEWGAVAYLSHSVYGINKEVNINNNSSYKTGYSALTTTNQTTYPGTYGDGSNYNNAYNTTTGYLASTTGNITGIYDMSGGAWEYMASYMFGQLGSSGFTAANIATYNSKYFDIYSASSTITGYNYRILGDATGEIGPFYSYADGDGSTRYHNSWYADYSYFVESSYPWFNRGGGYYSGVLAGQFNFSRNTGAVYTSVGSRLVLAG
ncbi:MAG: prepilin-type N-terminal cleavage/methylation domain-containing protein [Bacilli bacterium]|nr:prepilin-type N-terminal cleavage/methylation domain-containing protein [Bacilli bacterium]MDD3452790.1 prepilin-type N-terminal cleavage/methylation domain-containing protein [Bacilli bacterium]